jgi:hypothetical protein
MLIVFIFLLHICVRVQRPGVREGRWWPGTTATVRCACAGRVVLQGHLQEVYGRRVRFSFIQLEQLFEISS